MTKRLLLLKVFLVFLIVLCLFPIKGLAVGNTLTVGLDADAQYNSFQEALSSAQSGDILEIISDIEETKEIKITKDITIIARNNVKLTAKRGFNVVNNSKLILGDGNTENNLDITGFIDNRGSLVVKDGFVINSRITNLDGSTYQGEGGTFKKPVEIATNSKVSGKITGGNYICSDGDVFSVYGTYDEIAGGRFVSEGTVDRSAVYVQGKLHKISGGEFSSSIASGMNVQHGGDIDEISGGTFKGVKRAIIVYAGGTDKSRIGVISGGTFESSYGLLLFSHNAASVSVDEISGGTFIGKKSALQLEKDTVLGRITGGKFVGDNYAILNVGNIHNIDGGNFDGGYYSIFNYTNGTIENINNGIFKGYYSAVYNRSNGTIKNIHNGVFAGEIYYAYENHSNNETYIEPNLNSEIGNGRYSGKVDAIVGKVIYPDGFHMSSPNTVLEVDAIPETSFRYLKKSFTLSYDANGGSGNKPSDQVEASDDDVLTVASNPFTYAGKEFIGWNSKADGTGITYQPNDTISLSSTENGQHKPLGNVTLYAQWQKIYQVLYDTNGANEPTPVDTKQYKLGDTITLSNVTLTKEGYDFKGWKLADNNSYQANEAIVLDESIAAMATNSNLTFVAIWEETPKHDTNVDKNPTDNSDDNSNGNKTPINLDDYVIVQKDSDNKVLPNTGYTINLINSSLIMLVAGCLFIVVSIARKRVNK